jgi:hypothetical protein
VRRLDDVGQRRFGGSAYRSHYAGQEG